MEIQQEQPDRVREKIQALLAEYGGLRAESVNRNTNIFQLIAAVVVLVGLALSRPAFDWRFWIVIAVGVVFSAVLGNRIHRDIELAAARMREIEGRVNELVGEPVMMWETYWGGSVRGYFWRRAPDRTEIPNRPR